VRYWLMTPVAGEFARNDEVDELVWLTPDDARALLSYERDGALLARAL
jgi:8-oxo-dGTP diphosphatase